MKHTSDLTPSSRQSPGPGRSWRWRRPAAGAAPAVASARRCLPALPPRSPPPAGRQSVDLSAQRTIPRAASVVRLRIKRNLITTDSLAHRFLQHWQTPHALEGRRIRLAFWKSVGTSVSSGASRRASSPTSALGATRASGGGRRSTSLPASAAAGGTRPIATLQAHSRSCQQTAKCCPRVYRPAGEPVDQRRVRQLQAHHVHEIGEPRF